MSDGKVLEFAEVTMLFGDVPAVDGLTARIDPGRVTAFLGPNGAGKTTTLRVLLGDLRPTRGRATIGGRSYHQITRPAASIGAVMDIAALDKARRKTATKHLSQAARKIGVGTGRVSEVLALVGLAEMGDMRIGSLSLGMKHRLAVAQALLGDPGVLVFDEPANGLDPEGIRWIRLLMRRFADEGRTVVMSSHLLSEVEQVADALLVLNEGELLFEGPIEMLSQTEGGLVTVDADDRDALTAALDAAGLSYRMLRTGIAVADTTSAEIGSVAARAGIALTALTHRGPTLEDIYLQIIDGTWNAPAQTAAMDPRPFARASAEAAAVESVEAGVAEATAAAEASAGDADAEDADDADADVRDDADVPAEESDAHDVADDEKAEAEGGTSGAEAAADALPGAAALADLAHDVREGDDAEERDGAVDADDDGVGETFGAGMGPAPIAESDADTSPAEEQAEQDAAADAADAAGEADDVAEQEPGDDAHGETAVADETAAEDDGAQNEASAADVAEDPVDAAAESGLIESVPADVSPAVAAAFATADRLERDADAIEAGIEADESRAEEADDEWESQLRAMFEQPVDDEDDADAAPPAPAASFTGASFGVAATRSIDISQVAAAPDEDDADDDVLKDDLIGRDDS